MPKAERENFTEPGDPTTGSKGKSKDLERLIEWLGDAENSTAETDYREVSAEDYDFYAGDQDTQEVMTSLEEQNRPNTTYNEVKPKIDMLIGLAAQMKYQPVFLPVGTEDEALAELMQGTIAHFRKKMKLLRRELECFDHMVKSGRSLLYFYIDSSNPFKPEIKAKRYPGIQFYIDGDSLEYDMSDARYLFIEKWMDEEEIKTHWSKFDIGLASQSTTADTPEFFDEAKEKYRIVEGWYYKYEEVTWFINPLTGKEESLNKKDFAKFVKILEEQGMQVPQGIESFAKVPYYMIFCGDNELASGRSPFNWKGFPVAFYGAYKFYKKNSWFGPIKSMKDPQRSINTQRRQLVHLLQTLPKGLLLHEVGAILDISEYENKSSQPNFHLELAKGTIDKVKFMTQPQISTIYQSFDQTCVQSMKDSSGIQDSLMGLQTSSREPGVTVRMRQESGLAVLFSLFDNFGESRLNGDKILMSLVQQYVTEDTIIRIQGEKGSYLTHVNSQMNPQIEGFNDISVAEFDLVLDEEVETSSTRMATAQVLNDFVHNNPNSIPPDIILDYSNVPYMVKQRVKEHWEMQQQRQQELEDREYKLELLKLSIAKDKNKESKETKEKKGD